MCPSRPIVPHGMGGTVLGTPIVPPYMALSHVSVPSHRPTWDGPRDVHRSTLQDTWESLGQSLLSHVGQWDGTGRTHGTSHVGWDTWESQGQSLLSHVGQWDGTDTWDKPCRLGHMGVPRTVPPVPCATVGRDGHMGQAMYNGTHGSP